jgi:hypothetical protein
MPRGRLTSTQVNGFEAIIEFCSAAGMRRSHCAYVLATAYHETAYRMAPVREGLAKSDEGAIRAVTSLYDRGIISRNYAIRDANGHSYYGRGLVQLTFKENYKKIGDILGVDLVNNPDLMLNNAVSVPALVLGMQRGTFRRRRSLDMLPSFPTDEQWITARDIINGDVKKNGPKIMDHAKLFLLALQEAK